MSKGIINLRFYSKSRKRSSENIHEESKVKFLNLFIEDIYNHINFLKKKSGNCINRLKFTAIGKITKYFSISTKKQYENVYNKQKTDIPQRESVIECNTKDKHNLFQISIVRLVIMSIVPIHG